VNSPKIVPIIIKRNCEIFSFEDFKTTLARKCVDKFYLIKRSLLVVMLERIGEAVGTLVAAAGIPGVAALLQGVPPHGGG
jgi:hypothetical protein